MKAIVATKFGPPEVLQLQEIVKPTPKDDEILVEIHATTVSARDCRMQSLNLPALFRLPIQHGLKVMIYGASESVGTYTVKLAKYFGTEVTGACSTAHQAMVKSPGADGVFDYTKDDFFPGEERYDVIFDTVGKFPKSKIPKTLTSNGIYVTIARLSTKEGMENLTIIRELIEAGRVKAVIDRCYLLEDMVAAHRYVDTGHKQGNVIITTDQNHGEQTRSRT
jgi:NADPH:quinone reductase-like Zn-dependent oxidoreductase